MNEQLSKETVGLLGELAERMGVSPAEVAELAVRRMAEHEAADYPGRSTGKPIEEGSLLYRVRSEVIRRETGGVEEPPRLTHPAGDALGEADRHQTLARLHGRALGASHASQGRPLGSERFEE